MLRLEDRRKYFDICLLHSTIHNPFLSQLKSQLNFRPNYADARRRCPFRLSPTRTLYGRMRDSVERAATVFNNEFDSIDIMNITLNRLKSQVLLGLTLNHDAMVANRM